MAECSPRWPGLQRGVTGRSPTVGEQIGEPSCRATKQQQKDMFFNSCCCFNVKIAGNMFLSYWRTKLSNCFPPYDSVCTLRTSKNAPVFTPASTTPTAGCHRDVCAIRYLKRVFFFPSRSCCASLKCAVHAGRLVRWFRSGRPEMGTKQGGKWKWRRFKLRFKAIFKSRRFYYYDLNKTFLVKIAHAIYLMFNLPIIYCFLGAFDLHLNRVIIEQRKFITGWTQTRGGALLSWSEGWSSCAFHFVCQLRNLQLEDKSERQRTSN